MNPLDDPRPGRNAEGETGAAPTGEFMFCSICDTVHNSGWQCGGTPTFVLPLEEPMVTMPDPDPPTYRVEQPADWQRCPVCNGTGMVMAGFYPDTPVNITSALTEVCRTCGGRGVIRRE